VCCGTQTDLTALDIGALEVDYQQHVKECSEVHHTKGFPDQEDFETDEKLLNFYTSLNSFTVLMGVFDGMVASALPENPLAKLTKFQSFTLTLMKMWLNASNFDLAFRFGISATTVGRVFSRWIQAMDARLAFLLTWPDCESLQKTMPTAVTACLSTLRLASMDSRSGSKLRLASSLLVPPLDTLLTTV